MRAIPIAQPGQRSADLALEAGVLALKRSGLDFSEIGAHIHLSAHDLKKRPLWNETVEILGGLDGRSLTTTAMRDICNGLIFAEWAIPRLFFQDEPGLIVTTGDEWSGMDRYLAMPGLAFSDMGAAIVITRDQRDSRTRIISAGHANEPQLAPMHRMGGRFDPRTSRHIHEATRIPRDKTIELIRSVVGRSVEQALTGAGLTARDITILIGPFLSVDLFDSECRPPLTDLGFVPSQLSWYLNDVAPDYAHTGTSDPLIGCHVAIPHLLRGQRMVLFGMGAGYSVSSLVVQRV